MSRYGTGLIKSGAMMRGSPDRGQSACLVPDTANGFSTITPAKFIRGCKSSVSRFGQPPIRAASTIAASQYDSRQRWALASACCTSCTVVSIYAKSQPGFDQRHSGFVGESIRFRRPRRLHIEFLQHLRGEHQVIPTQNRTSDRALGDFIFGGAYRVKENIGVNEGRHDRGSPPLANGHPRGTPRLRPTSGPEGVYGAQTRSPRRTSESGTRARPPIPTFRVRRP